MDLDRDLLQRAKGRDRGEDLDDPGRRTNTDRMPPTAAGATKGLYPKTSPLAGGSSEQEQTAPALRYEKFDESNVRGQDPKHREKHGKPSNASKQAPQQAAAPGASPKTDPSPNSDAAAKADAKAETKSSKPGNMPKAAAAKDPDRKEGGQGGPTTAGTGGSQGTPGAAAGGDIRSETAKPAPGDASLARTNVALGETVTFHALTAGAWTASASNNTPSAQGDTFVWKAPKIAGSVTITFTPTTGSAKTKTMNVVAPSSIDFRKLRDDPQPPAGAGMWTNLTFGPQTVNFYEVEWLELPGDASNVEGYFEQLQLQEGRMLHHNPAAEGAPMSFDGAPNHGVDDHAFTGDNPPLTRTVVDLFGERRYFAGAYEWVVPNQYRVRGEAGEGTHIKDVVQRFAMDDAGKVTVSKGGASAAQAQNGVADANGMILTPFPTVDIAAGLIAGAAGNTAGQVIWGLGRLSSYRAHDPASYANLVAALRQFEAKLYVALRCTNTYSIFTRDDVVLNVTGTNCWSQSFPINDGSTGAVKQWDVPWLSVIDPNTFNSNTHLHYHVTAEGHSFEVSLGLPFAGYGTQQDLPGSEGRYKLTTFLK